VRSLVAPHSGGPPLPLVQIHGTSDAYWPYDGGLPHGLRRRILHNASPAEVLGVDEWAALLARANGADGGPVATSVSEDVDLRRWIGRNRSDDLAFYRIAGGGHTWPGARIALPGFIFGRTSHTFHATEEIWSFFSSHRRESP
jgi:polyhydroxybutyrate depolymerase